jgi:hypothetical protein
MVSILYDDDPSNPNEADAYIDDPAETSLPRQWAVQDFERTRLNTSLPASVRDICKGYHAWGFQGTNMMGYAFILPYTSPDLIPTCYGPVRSPITMTSRNKSKATTHFKPFSVSSSPNLKKIMQGISIDALECKRTLIDMDEFEKQTAAANSGSSTSSESRKTSKATPNVSRVRKAKTKQPISSEEHSSESGVGTDQDSGERSAGEEDESVNNNSPNVPNPVETSANQGTTAGTVVMQNNPSNRNDSSEEESTESDYDSSD